MLKREIIAVSDKPGGAQVYSSVVNCYIDLSKKPQSKRDKDNFRKEVLRISNEKITEGDYESVLSIYDILSHASKDKSPETVEYLNSVQNELKNKFIADCCDKAKHTGDYDTVARIYKTLGDEKQAEFFDKAYKILIGEEEIDFDYFTPEMWIISGVVMSKDKDTFFKKIERNYGSKFGEQGRKLDEKSKVFYERATAKEDLQFEDALEITELPHNFCLFFLNVIIDSSKNLKAEKKKPTKKKTYP